MDDGVRIIAIDSPAATEFGINIKAAMDQEEAERASIRTREALAALKARGVKLGGDHGIGKFAKDGSIAGAKARRANADEFAHSMRFIVDAIQKEGANSAAEIARKLNEQEPPAAVASGALCRSSVSCNVSRKSTPTPHNAPPRARTWRVGRGRRTFLRPFATKDADRPRSYRYLAWYSCAACDRSNRETQGSCIVAKFSPPTNTTPLDARCPSCQAAIGANCYAPDRPLSGWQHARRRQRWLKEMRRLVRDAHKRRWEPLRPSATD